MFGAFIDEILTEHMTSIIGKFSLADVARIRIFSHSGGYNVIGNMATVGGVNQKVMDLCLLDSLYANFDQFDAYVTNNLPEFGTNSTRQYRFTSVYTLNGGTYNNNLAMAARAKSWVDQAGTLDMYLLDNDCSHEVTAAEISQYSLLYKYSNLSHNDIPRNYFYHFLLSAL